MKPAVILASILLAVPLIAFLSGMRIFVIKPIGAIPEGRTVLLHGAPGLNWVDSPDALCMRTTGSVTLFCRMAALGAAVKDTTIVARLPYSSVLDAVAGTPVTAQ